MHLFDGRRASTAATPSSAGGLPLAVGLALADTMAARRQVTVCFFGEGAVAEGEFHEAINLAALWQLPVLFCCENNLYAMGTALDRSESQTDIALKAAAYEIPAMVGRRNGRRSRSRRRRGARWMRCAPAAAPTSSNCAPTGSAPTRCTTRSCYREQIRGDEVEGTRPHRHVPRSIERRPADSPMMTGQRCEAEITAEIDDAVAFAEAGTPGTGRRSDPVRLQRGAPR